MQFVAAVLRHLMMLLGSDRPEKWPSCSTWSVILSWSSYRRNGRRGTGPQRGFAITWVEGFVISEKCMTFLQEKAFYLITRLPAFLVSRYVCWSCDHFDILQLMFKTGLWQLHWGRFSGCRAGGWLCSTGPQTFLNARVTRKPLLTS